MELNPQERLNLRKMVSESDCGDNTEDIRRLKHSDRILEEVSKIERLKRANAEMRKERPDEFQDLCISECTFLYNGYTDIFNKLMKDEINLGILAKMIKVLKRIENGEMDQHEGSVIVGKILKELYVDSALRRGENLDKQYAATKVEPIEAKELSWRQYKVMNGK